MFTKKKTVPALPRSRFIKPKPNLKVLPKSSQQNEKEKKHEESFSLCSNKSEVSEITLPKISDGAFNKNSDKFTPLLPKDFKVSEKVTPQVSHETVSSNVLKFLAEDKNTITAEKHLSGRNVEKDSSKETFSKDCTQNFNGNASSCTHVDSPEKNSNVNLLETCSSSSSPAKENSDSLTKKNLSFEHSNKITYEKSINFSPAKFSSIDKRYPCITKILSAPKKRSKNVEVRERKKMMASYKHLPPRSEMTFTDLIFWNPNTSPMKSKESKPGYVFNPIEKDTISVEEEKEEEDSVAPKLFVNENGEIILDESSLVVKRKKTNVDMTSEAIIIDDSNITYSSFRRRISKLWTPKETVKFYKALSVVGTDFALMENIMPNRTRRELKIKFKKEEKINMELLQRAMYETETFQTDLNIEDLNLDVIDIPGLEESIAKDLTDLDYAVKRQRGRPKKEKDRVAANLSSSNLESQHSVNDTSVVISRGRGRPKKTIDSSSVDLPAKETDVSPANVLIESDESSPLIRKRKVKVLSLDSLEENSTEDFFEIEVQIKSPKTKTQEQNMTVSNLADILTTSYDESTSQDKLSKKQLTPKTSLIKHDEHKDIFKSRTEKDTIPKIPHTNRKPKRVNLNPNIESPEKESVIKESSDVFQNGSFIFPTSPNSIIEVTDEKLLSDGITDVVTSVHTKVSKRKHQEKSEQNNFCNTLHRLQPSSKHYTPVDEMSDDAIKCEAASFNSIRLLGEPVFFKNPDQRKYGSCETKEHKKRTASPAPSSPLVDNLLNLKSSLMSSCETKEHKKRTASPVPSSPLVDNLLNLKSSLMSSLSMSSKEPITISVTPEQSENSNALMLMAQSPEGNSVHFYVANHFTGRLALPPEISVPPSDIVIKCEEDI